MLRAGRGNLGQEVVNRVSLHSSSFKALPIGLPRHIPACAGGGGGGVRRVPDIDKVLVWFVNFEFSALFSFKSGKTFVL